MGRGGGAHRCTELLADPALTREHVSTLRAAGAGLTWRRTATELASIYEDVIDSPSPDARVILAETYGQHKGLDRYSKALVGPEGVLPEKMTRPLLAISQSRVLRASSSCPYARLTA